ncbi:hypothetical protein [Lentibacter sp. XHP0401]|uniref:hypothetical protein n=1 Tax=Lentibacter sp. XHP0401 TaxID=2984334 RepID=UPI0021E965AD|nr:hypothetical protein [Lentibacter sp. XHP0401]MCV2891748.1 hypothetical protein [Lentibacter sp. XHP0401]
MRRTSYEQTRPECCGLEHHSELGPVCYGTRSRNHPIETRSHGAEGAAECGCGEFAPREMLLCLEDVAQWMGIATEMEHSYEKQSKNTRSGGRERSLDLEAARLSIGGKLDRLRAAAGAERVSELVE